MIKTIKKYLKPKDPPDPIPKVWIYLIIFMVGMMAGKFLAELIN